MQFAPQYSAALRELIERELTSADGMDPTLLAACEQRLQLKLPVALREYYLLAGQLPLNQEHNRLYLADDLRIEDGKLLFMEENQYVVFWGMNVPQLQQPDPEVFQAVNASPLEWYSQEVSFSEFIIKMWRWQHGLDPGL